MNNDKLKQIQKRHNDHLQKCRNKAKENILFIEKNIHNLTSVNVQTVKDIIEQLQISDKILIYTFE